MGSDIEKDYLYYGENGDDWKKYKLWVVENIRRLIKDIEKLDNNINVNISNKINDLENKITALQVKAGIWGMLSGLLGVAITMLIKSQVE